MLVVIMFLFNIVKIDVVSILMLKFFNVFMCIFYWYWFLLVNIYLVSSRMLVKSDGFG